MPLAKEATARYVIAYSTIVDNMRNFQMQIPWPSENLWGVRCGAK